MKLVVWIDADWVSSADILNDDTKEWVHIRDCVVEDLRDYHDMPELANELASLTEEELGENGSVEVIDALEEIRMTVQIVEDIRNFTGKELP